MNYQHMLEELKAKLIKYPDNDEIMSNIASAQMEVHNFYGALIMLRKAIRLKPNVQTLTNLGYFLTYEGEPAGGRRFRQEEKAIEYLEEAAKLLPWTHHTYSLLGEAYIKVGRYSEAESALDKAIAFACTIANQNNLGVALYYHQVSLRQHFATGYMRNAYFPELKDSLCINYYV